MCTIDDLGVPLRDLVFQACRQAVREKCEGWLERLIGDGPDRFEPPNILVVGTGDHAGPPERYQRHRRQILRAHLLVARAVLSCTPSGTPASGSRLVLEKCLDDPGDPAAGTCASFIRDLAQLLALGGKEASEERVQSEEIGLLLVAGRADGVNARLIVELVNSPPATIGELYPHPEMAFVCRDASFCNAEGAAWDATMSSVGWRRGDVRWKIVIRSRLHAVEHLPLEGGSAGGAFALVLRELLKEDRGPTETALAADGLSTVTG